MALDGAAVLCIGKAQIVNGLGMVLLDLLLLTQRLFQPFDLFTPYFTTLLLLLQLLDFTTGVRNVILDLLFKFLNSSSQLLGLAFYLVVLTLGGRQLELEHDVCIIQSSHLVFQRRLLFCMLSLSFRVLELIGLFEGVQLILGCFILGGLGGQLCHQPRNPLFKISDPILCPHLRLLNLVRVLQNTRIGHAETAFHIEDLVSGGYLLLQILNLLSVKCLLQLHDSLMALLLSFFQFLLPIKHMYLHLF
mmetsp:Transcript_26825/g.48203  ORF Transcript_26825/g.48203 Transcript_26825/m.48203 type:complete len:248 (-) Transcript_26825:1459-2202(-)